MIDLSAEPKWLIKAVVLSVHSQQIQEHGGARGIADSAMLDLALHKPKQLWSYNQPKPSIPTLAAAYAFGLSKNYAFVDGNKRVAAVACELFLLINGYQFLITEIEKYPHYLALASGEHDLASFASWLHEVTDRKTPQKP